MVYKNNDIKKILKSGLLAAVSLLILYACANPGTPTGGPVDVDPPVVIGSSPSENAINNKKPKIVINFDEYIKLDKPNEKVIISPPQLQQAEIKTSGKKISINLLDSLKANSTYTIDFSDAIQDNNEGNPMGNYTFSFSTGAVIDTMEVSGTVLNAEDLEPIKGILVGLQSNLNDSAFVKLPFNRVARTDSRGHFVIKGIARGKYHIFALYDSDTNFYLSQKSEQYAFNDDIITPDCSPSVRQDTTWVDSLTIDTIVPQNYTHFTPDNIVLRAFKEVNSRQQLKKKERLVPQKFSLIFTAPNKELPKIRGLNFDEKDAFVIEDPTLKKDSLIYWVKDSVIYKKDTLSLELSYLYTDSLEHLVPKTDTLNLVSKQKIKDKKDEKKKSKKKKEEEKVASLSIEKHIPQQMDVYDYIYFDFEEPIRSFNKDAIHLKQKIDTIYKDIPFKFEQDSLNIRRYNLYYDWEPEKDYAIEVDSAAFVGLYGLVSDKIKQDIKVKALKEYGDIFFNVSGTVDPRAYVELLDGTGKVVRKIPVRNGRASFYFLGVGKYGARLVNDRNGNGIWDAGDYTSKQQPEEVYYYPKIVELKVMWKLEENWNINATPLDKQKPDQIKKQKPDKDKNKNQNNNYNRS
jgi:hypothetical protein